MNLFGGFYPTSRKYQQAPQRNVQAKKRYHRASSAAAWYYSVHLVFQLHRSWYCSNFSIKPISGDGTLICTTESCIIRRIHLWVLQVRHFPFQSSTFVHQGTFSYLLCILLLFWKASAVRERPGCNFHCSLHSLSNLCLASNQIWLYPPAFAALSPTPLWKSTMDLCRKFTFSLYPQCSNFLDNFLWLDHIQEKLNTWIV